MATSSAVLCDIDGVLWNGGKNNPIPNASEAIKRLTSANIPILFVTNGGGKVEHYKAEELSFCLQLPIAEDQVVTSHTPMMHYLKEQGFDRKPVLFVGHDCKTIHQIAEFYRFEDYITLDEFIHAHSYLVPWTKHYSQFSPTRSVELSKRPISAVVMLHEPVYWGESLQVLCDVLRSEDGIIHPNGMKVTNSQRIPLFVANPDFVYPSGFPVPRFTSGAFNMCLSRLYAEHTGQDLKIEFYGKPLQSIYDFSKHFLECKYRHQIDTLYCIGDNPLSDIKGANDAGASYFSILVRTGCWSGIDNDEQNPAKFVCADVFEACQFILNSSK